MVFSEAGLVFSEIVQAFFEIGLSFFETGVAFYETVLAFSQTGDICPHLSVLGIHVGPQVVDLGIHVGPQVVDLDFQVGLDPLDIRSHFGEGIVKVVKSRVEAGDQTSERPAQQREQCCDSDACESGSDDHDFAFLGSGMVVSQ